jgi:hypothetical protein
MKRAKMEKASFPLVLHPDTSGMTHIIGMIDRVINWLKAKGDDVNLPRSGRAVRRYDMVLDIGEH